MSTLYLFWPSICHSDTFCSWKRKKNQTQNYTVKCVCVFALEWLIWKAYFILFQDLYICRCFLCVLNSIKKNLCIEKEQIRTQRNLIGTYRLVELSTESIEISVIHSKKIIVYCASCSKWAWVDMLFESWI